MDDGLVAQMGRYGTFFKLVHYLKAFHLLIKRQWQPLILAGKKQHKKGDHGQEGRLTVKSENSEEELIAADRPSSSIDRRGTNGERYWTL